MLELSFIKLKSIKNELINDLFNHLSKIEETEKISIKELETEVRNLKNNTCKEKKVRSKIENILHKHAEYLHYQNMFFDYLGELSDDGVKIIYKELRNFINNEK